MDENEWMVAYTFRGCLHAGQMRKERWETTQQNRIKKLMTQIENAEGETKKDFETRLKVLKSLNDSYKDIGPVYDCVVWNDGEKWVAVVDT